MNLSEVFKEGETYPLKVIDLKSLNEAQFYLLQTEMGTKIMLSYKLYAGYGFEKGETILCHLDKINCNGRLFFEPIHPFYKVGNTYEFTLEKEEVLANGLDKLWTLQDEKGTRIVIPNLENNTLQIGGHLSCFIKGIKKSFLNIIPKAYLIFNYDTALTHSFLISGTFWDNEEYYILKHLKTSEKIVLKFSKYETYGFKVGDTIECRCIKPASFPHYIFEPEHPHFKIGECYIFRVTLIEEYLLNEIQQVVSLIDIRGNKARLLLAQPRDYFLGQKVSCRLVDVRNAKLIVEPENV